MFFLILFIFFLFLDPHPVFACELAPMLARSSHIGMCSTSTHHNECIRLDAISVGTKILQPCNTSTK